VLLAIGAAGGLTGSLVANRLIRWFGHRHVLTLSIAVAAGTPALLVVLPNRVAAAAVVVTTSAAFAAGNVGSASLRQRLVPERLLGRVVAAARTLTVGCTAFGALLGGALADGAGADAPFVLSAAIAVVATAAWWHSTRRDTRRDTGRDPQGGLT
jgi:predicted MFS family arabinose efflux permease